MTVQAKFRCTTITEYDCHSADQVHFNVELAPVIADRPENKSWSKYTPSGELKMTITNPAARDTFKVGHEYLLTIEKASVEADEA